jgi:hypothetical protein
VEAEYRAYAIDKGCDAVRETEEAVVTPAMKRVEAEDPERRLVGLEFRLKGRDRIEEKVKNWTDAEPSITVDQAFKLVKDAIRYTFQYPQERYAPGVEADCARLKEQGFELVELRNSWANEEYKGINSRWRIPEKGQLFEVQFHTDDSFRAKQETHAAYEVLRNPMSSESEQNEAAQFQRRVTSRIPIPPGATNIPDYP